MLFFNTKERLGLIHDSMDNLVHLLIKIKGLEFCRGLRRFLFIILGFPGLRALHLARALLFLLLRRLNTSNGHLPQKIKNNQNLASIGALAVRYRNRKKRFGLRFNLISRW